MPLKRWKLTNTVCDTVCDEHNANISKGMLALNAIKSILLMLIYAFQLFHYDIQNLNLNTEYHTL